MAQHDYVIANGTGDAVRSDLNNGLSAIVTQNSGATEPATTYAFMRWADTTAGVMKMRNSANNAWITLYQLDGEWTNIAFENGTAAAPSIYFKDSGTDTGFYSPGANQVGISTGGTARLTIDSNGNVDIDSNTLYVDATNNRVGLGVSDPGQKLVIGGGTNGRTRIKVDSGSGNFGKFEFSTDSALTTSAVQVAEITANITGTGPLTSSLQFATNAGNSLTNAMTIDSSQRVGIGTTSPGALLTLAASVPELRLVDSDNSLYGTITAPGGDIYIDADKGNGAGGSIIRFAVDDSEKARLDSSGRLLVGTSSTSGNITANDKLAVVITGDNTQGGISVTDYAGTGSTTGSNACLRLQRSIGTTDGSFTALTASAWGLGRIEFNGSNGSGFGTGATIEGIADSAAWGSGDHPARLVFSTTADGASSPTERLRINQAGHLLYDYANIREQSSNYSQFGGNTTAYPTLELYAKNSSYASTLQQNIVNRAATNGYYFLDCYSGPGAADFEFRLRGDGQAYADQSWNGGGADYAEYFEWSDGNLGEEDRRGISVVLDGDRIRPAIDGEDPIGVISGNPSVVGDAAWNKWSGKYLRDDYGTYIQEDYEVVNDEGETVIQQRRRLNPAYDPDQEYVNREQRPEWDCVGLMGKLRIRKGQPTGSRWIKMRDISDSVEEWLVR